MANIEIAAVCNLKCPYCFAEPHMQRMQSAPGGAFISLDVYEQRLDFLERSGIDQVRLIGGEPTLHPRFPELVQRARRRGKQIMVFSHGLMPEKALAVLEALPPEQCMVLINMNAMKTAAGPGVLEHARRERTIRRLGPRALLGYNIYSPDFSLDFVLPIIQASGCHKTVRVGLAHPTLQGDNAYLHPKQYPLVGRRLVEFCRAAAEAGVALSFDCGFVRCMFSDDDLEILRRAKADIGWRCSPILDVGIGGAAVHCFPLAGVVEVSLDGESGAATVRDDLAARVALYRGAGIYRECSTCRFKLNGECSGGGLEHVLRRFRHTPFRVVAPAEPAAAEVPPAAVIPLNALQATRSS